MTTETGTEKMTKRARKIEQEAFVPRVLEIVLQAGGREDLDTFAYTHVIPVTAYGPLYVSAYNPDGRFASGWIACRFLYPELAQGKAGGQSLNPYSGKWNFHFHQGTTVDEAVEEFRRSLHRILIPGFGEWEKASKQVECLELQAGD